MSGRLQFEIVWPAAGETLPFRQSVQVDVDVQHSGGRLVIVQAGRAAPVTHRHLYLCTWQLAAALHLQRGPASTAAAHEAWQAAALVPWLHGRILSQLGSRAGRASTVREARTALQQLGATKELQSLAATRPQEYAALYLWLSAQYVQHQPAAAQPLPLPQSFWQVLLCALPAKKLVPALKDWLAQRSSDRWWRTVSEESRGEGEDGKKCLVVLPTSSLTARARSTCTAACPPRCSNWCGRI